MFWSDLSPNEREKPPFIYASLFHVDVPFARPIVILRSFDVSKL